MLLPNWKNTVWEVTVPIHSTTANGIHVFTGHAADSHAALAAAHAVCDRARLALTSGTQIPQPDGDGWAARGLRPAWVLDWHKATTRKWFNPNNLI